MALTLALERCRSAGDGGLLLLEAEGKNNNGDQQQLQLQERLLFEKVVTPSDVGKLNRLVVPKHFAEKHLPLLGAAARAGTVRCFHDARGGSAAWRFRYSYWGSSQSYVMTKGWSRYVRDKRLAAGDTVSFFRDGACLYIDCRRRRRGKRVVAAPASSSATPQALVAAQAQAALLRGGNGNNKLQQQQSFDEEAEARRGQRLRLFGVDLELRAEPLLLDLQL
jgi:hypothetical protein